MDSIHPLQTFREKHDPPLGQSDLAVMLDVSTTTVWRWEARKRKVDDELLARVSERTGIPKSILRPDLADLMNEAAE